MSRKLNVVFAVAASALLMSGGAFAATHGAARPAHTVTRSAPKPKPNVICLPMMGEIICG
jgi:hypothetical protein